jgi:cytochrome P450
MTPELSKLDEVNLFDSDIFVENRFHEPLRLLRTEDPVHWHPAGETFDGFWSLTKYDDVLHVSRNPELYKSGGGILGPALRPEALAAMMQDRPAEAMQASGGGMGNILIMMDPPRHVKMRRLVNKGFTPRAVNAMEPEIRRIANEVLDKIAGRSECDFVLEVASQLPLAVICGMMGLEEKHWPLMFELTNKLLGSDDTEYQTDVPEEQRGTSGAARQTAMVGMATLMGFFQQTLADRRANPRQDDLVSILLEADVDGEKLTEGDLLAFCFLLIIAGNETTRNAISGGMQAFSEHPAQKARLLGDMSLMDSAVEEVLRWVSPVYHMARTATADTEIRGKKINAGQRIIMWYPAVNRDEDVFADPYLFDIARTPNDHLAFGIGEHFCLGAGFARKELKVMFEELFRRFPDIETAGPPERLRSNIVSGVKHLPVRYTPENR